MFHYDGDHFVDAIRFVCNIIIVRYHIFDMFVQVVNIGISVKSAHCLLTHETIYSQNPVGAY